MPGRKVASRHIVDERNELVIFSELVTNVLSCRQEVFNRLTGTQKDLYEDCGYEATSQLTVDDFWFQYERNAVANRVINVFPKESWNVFPDVFESDSPGEKTPFEKTFSELGASLLGNSLYQASEPTEGNPIWEVLQKVDELSGIGHFGGILLGFDDGNRLEHPINKKKKSIKLLFMRPLDESVLSVSSLETEESSVRYGHPNEYLVTLATGQGGSLSGKQHKVHWSRIVHVADNTTNNPWLGTPRLIPVWNRIKDVDKLYGGSAEMYWRGAFPGLSIETHPQLGGDVEIDVEAVRSSVQNYMKKLQRYLALTGMTAKSLAPQVVDPTPQIERQIDAICIQLGCPKRVFVGSERGELASVQDDSTWNDRIRYRQNNYLTPKIVVPFIDRLIQAGVLPTPKKFSVVWPDLDSLTDGEKADIAVKRTMALGQYVADDVETVVPFMEFLTLVLKLSRGDALAVYEAAQKLKKSEKERLTTPKLELEAQAAKLKAGAKQEGNPATRVKQQAQKGKLKSQQPRNLIKKK